LATGWSGGVYGSTAGLLYTEQREGTCELIYQLKRRWYSTALPRVALQLQCNGFSMQEQSLTGCRWVLLIPHRQALDQLWPLKRCWKRESPAATLASPMCTSAVKVGVGQGSKRHEHSELRRFSWRQSKLWLPAILSLRERSVLYIQSHSACDCDVPYSLLLRRASTPESSMLACLGVLSTGFPWHLTL